MAGAFAVLISECAHCPSYTPGHPIATDGSGHQICAQHHVPLVTARGYVMNVPRVPTIDPANDAEIRLEECNPNAISDYQSLRHNKLFSVQRKVTYCPQCESNVHQYRLEHWRGYYRPEDSGGSWFPEKELLDHFKPSNHAVERTADRYGSTF
jgi:hypothetical protein